MQEEQQIVELEPQILLKRVVSELDLLVEMSLKVQSCLHELELSQATADSRKVLQSTDILTQSLQCITSTLREMPHHSDPDVQIRLEEALDGVFLEDLRTRLKYGVMMTHQKSIVPPGEADFF